MVSDSDSLMCLQATSGPDRPVCRQCLVCSSNLFPELRESRYLLLSCLRIPVLAVGSYAEVFQLLEPTCYNLLVLSIRPNERQASHVATHVLSRWPSAKILVLGGTCEYLGDPMCDERVNACCNPSGVVKAAERLLKSARTGRIFR